MLLFFVFNQSCVTDALQYWICAKNTLCLIWRWLSAMRCYTERMAKTIIPTTNSNISTLILVFSATTSLRLSTLYLILVLFSCILETWMCLKTSLADLKWTLIIHSVSALVLQMHPSSVRYGFNALSPTLHLLLVFRHRIKINVR